MDGAGLLDEIIGLLSDENISYCVIGGQGVNAYVDPLVSLDLDLVIAVDQLERAAAILRRRFKFEEFPHSLNVSAPGSNLRVQIQTDPRYFPFVTRAEEREVLGVRLPVARVADVFQGKVWAALDATRRPTKRQKDLLDIARLIEAYPELREGLPAEIVSRLEPMQG